jgi:hypothetical protein
MKQPKSNKHGLFFLRRPESWVLPCGLLFLLWFGLTDRGFSRGSAPVYEDPFDVAAGGASLTRASQAGMIFSNPALIPYGTGFHRWLGNETSLIIGKDSADFAKSLTSGSGADDGGSGNSQFINTVLTTPIHAGVLNNFSYINRFVGFSVFNRGEFDVSVKRYGATGLPVLRFRSESYQGIGFSSASLLLGQMLSFGATAKFIYAGEPDLEIELTDQQAIADLQSASGLRSLVAMNTGSGYDAGLVFFKQGANSDYRLALKIDDIGGSKMSGDASLKELKQMSHVGLSYTWHNSVDSLHLSADLRDTQAASGDGLFKRVRFGAKLLLRHHIGISAGYYDGWPSYGVEVDAWLVRLTAAYYKREMGAKPGLDSRAVYLAGFAMGI